MLKTLGLLGGLAAIWLLLSGYWNVPLLLVCGALSCILVLYIVHRMNVVDAEAIPIHLGPRIAFYWLWLLKEIAKANIAVMKVVFSDLSEMQPQILTFETGLKTDMGKVILANSITLTPGTVTVELIGDRLSVHALTRAAADPSTILEMERRIAKLEAKA